jgi:hypothetical protein
MVADDAQVGHRMKHLRWEDARRYVAAWQSTVARNLTEPVQVTSFLKKMSITFYFYF